MNTDDPIALEGEDSSFMRLMRRSASLSFVGHRPVVEVLTTAILPKVYHTLLTEDVSSVPVYDSHKKKYVGWIDMHDLIAFTLEAFGRYEVPTNSSRLSFMSILHQEQENWPSSARHIAADIVGLSNKEPFISLPLGCSMLMVFLPFPLFPLFPFPLFPFSLSLSLVDQLLYFLALKYYSYKYLLFCTLNIKKKKKGYPHALSWS